MTNKYAHLAPRKSSTAHRRCVTKVRFPSQAAAQKAAERLGAKRGVALYPYNCALCLGWHNTSKAPA